MPSKVSLSKEKKFFANKNLFSNPTIRTMPPLRQSNFEEMQPKPKLEENYNSLVKENLLSSSKALKYKKEIENPPKIESP